ncbi:MalY/PatB family protein [Leptotrichia sp. HSP-342]|uniref:cysteine-S-conjugate beta-lyase n=1 Tax=Leptotrichia mesophila TaxID=3239303 RepID=A0AB39VC36_9FUSO
MSKKYDFETILSRKGQGSYKWEQMYEVLPELEDDIVPFSVADMELKIAPEITEGMKKYIDEAVLGYSGTYLKYYEAVIGWMERRYGFKVEKDWILCTPGVVSAIYAAIKAFAKENEGVITFTPVYFPFYSSITSNNRKLVDCGLVESKNENGEVKYSIDFEKFEEFAKDKNNKILLLCSPHNPLGIVWSREDLEKIGKIAVENDLIVISDEIHSDIVMAGHKHTVFQTLSEKFAEITITCTAPTKSFNLAGAGISNIIIKNEKLRKKFKAEIEKMSMHVFSTLAYKACELAYTESEEWLDEFLLLIDKNQKLVNKFFEERFVDLKAPLIQGTYLQWLDFRPLGLKNTELKEFMNKKSKIFFSEGYTFGKAGDGFERVNLAVPTKYLEKMLERLYEVLKVEFPKFCK